MRLQRLDHDRERDRRAERRAASDPMARAWPGQHLELPHETRLADTGVADQEHQARTVLGRGQLVLEPPQLARPAHERWRCHRVAECRYVSVPVSVPGTDGAPRLPDDDARTASQ